MEMMSTITLSALFFFFTVWGSNFIKSEIFSENLGMNFKSESWSFPNPQMEIMESLKEFHDAYLTSIILGIGTLTILIISLLYFSEETSLMMNSNFMVELSWIIVPMFILFLIGFPSIEYMYKMEEGEGTDVYTFKSTGFQWFWSYESSDLFSESYMSSDLEGDSPLYLSSSNVISLPLFTPIQNVVTSGDVMHSWALPSILMKIDAIPGRMNTLSFSIPSLEEVTMYGQCSELCGVNHSFMPIVVKAH